METTKDTPPIILQSDVLDMGLLRLLLTKYVVIAEQRGDKVIYGLNDISPCKQLKL